MSRSISTSPTSATSSSSICPCLSVLEQCRDIKQLKQIHGLAITLGLVRFTYVTSRILAFSAVSPFCDLALARRIFDRIPAPTIFNYNSMIKGYSRSSQPQLGLSIFSQMRAESVPPNMHTFPFAIKACACFASLAQVHGQVVKFGFEFDVYVVSSLIKAYSQHAVGLARSVFDKSPNRNVVSWTSLISGYCAQGLVREARRVFDEMPARNEVSWGAMISGYVRNECYGEAIELFCRLKEADLKPNRSVLVSVLNACADLGASEEGRWVHAYIDQGRFEYGLEVGTALVDFYAKCGCVESAQQVFNNMPKKDVMAWSAMIVGLAINGQSDSALSLFAEMERSGTKPNAITFIGVLSACSHGGQVGKGWEYFKLMSDAYGIFPMIEHYGCMVDLFGRSGRIAKAEDLIKSMPMKPDGVIWGALLNGCLKYGNLELGERIGRHLIEIEPQHSGRYVLLANMYASMGRWEQVVSVRKMMKERRVATVPGCSFIEISGIVHRFLADDKSHSQSQDIYEMLCELSKEVSLSNYELKYHDQTM